VGDLASVAKNLIFVALCNLLTHPLRGSLL